MPRVWLAILRLLLLYVAACLLAVEVGLQVRGAAEAGWGLAGSPDVPVALLDLPYAGINVSLEQYTPQQQADALARLADLGFGWVRQAVDWGAVGSSPGVSDWAATDAMIAAIRASGLEPVIVLEGSPAWARDPRDQANPHAPPADLADFTAFAAAFAQRYAGQVRYYQIWDEPNIAPNWGERLIEPAAYAQMLKAAGAAIRAADPDTVILLAALAPTADRGHTAIDEVYFLQRVYAAGAAPFFDAVAAQPFGFGFPPDEAAQRRDVLDFRRAAIVRRAMLAAGDAATPILGVRYGWNRQPDSPWATVSAGEQAAFAARAMQLARSEWPWLAGLAWAIDRPDAPPADPLWGFALTDPLAAALARTIAAEPGAPNPPHSPDPRIWALLLASAALITWRAWAAWRLLPAAAWAARYRGWPLIAQVVVWGGMTVLYANAASPPLIVLCWLAAGLLVWLRPQVGLWLAAALLPFYYWHKELHLVNVTLTVAPAYVFVFCLIPVVVVRYMRLRALPDAAGWLALAWLAVNLAAGVNVWNRPAYLQGVWEMALAPLILFWAARLLATDAHSRRQLGFALLVGASLASIQGLLDWQAGGGTLADELRRLAGPYYSPNHMALYLERNLLLGLGLIVGVHGRQRIALAPLLAVVALALLLTGSRGALLLGLPAGLLYLAWAAPRRPGRLNLFAVIVIGAVALVLALLLGWQYWPRLSNSATLLIRLETWRASLHLWADYLWLGVGPNGYFWRFPAYIPIGASLDPNLRHPHNIGLEYAAGWGIAGLIWLVAAGTVLVRSARRHRPARADRWLQLGAQAALIAGMVHGLVDAFAALPDLAAWNWLAVALLTVVDQDRHTPEKQKSGFSEKPDF